MCQLDGPCCRFRWAHPSNFCIQHRQVFFNLYPYHSIFFNLFRNTSAISFQGLYSVVRLVQYGFAFISNGIIYSNNLVKETSQKNSFFFLPSPWMIYERKMPLGASRRISFPSRLRELTKFHAILYFHNGIAWRRRERPLGTLYSERKLR